MALTEFPVPNFLGGPTDQYLNGDANQYQRADNLLMNSKGFPVSRPGSALFDSSNPRLPTGNQRVGALVNFNSNENLLALSGSKLYQYDSAWTHLTGPSGSDAIPGGSATARFMIAEWKKHLFIASSEKKPIVKVYKDSGGTFRVRTAGLPPVAEPDNFVSATVLSNAISLANSLRTNMKAHFTDTSQHITSDTVSDGIVASAASDLPTLITLTSSLIRSYVNHFNDYTVKSLYHYREDSSYTTGPGACVATVQEQQLKNTAHPTDLIECVLRLNDIAIKYSTHDGNDDAHHHQPGGQIWNAILDEPTRGPSITFNRQSIYDYANLVKTKWNEHLASGGTAGTAHSTAADTVNPIDAADATTLSSLGVLLSQCQFRPEFHWEDALLDSSWSYHVGQRTDTNGDPTYVFPNPISSYPFPDIFGGLAVGQWAKIINFLNSFKSWFNAHALDFDAHYDLDPANYVTHLIQGVDLQLASYNYAFVQKYEYTAGALTFVDRSAPIFRAASEVISIENEALTISNIPVLSNSSTNYDTSNVVIEIYRTTNDGTTYYLAGSVTNGTTSFSDGTKDEELQTRETLYTTGGVVDNDPPPQAKIIHIVDNVAYYANFTDGGVSYPNRIRQSVANDPDSCPADFFVDLPLEVMGFSSVKGIRIAGTAEKTYRVEGIFDELGRGSLEAISIGDVGWAGTYSPVETDDGLLFAGKDGFYLTDGYKVKRVSRDWAATYLNLVSTATRASNIQGALDRDKMRVYWTSTTSGSENDSLQVLDLNLPVTDNSVFTSASNETSFAPTAICFYNGQLIRGDSRGYVFKHDDAYTSDPKVDTNVTPSSWIKKPIRYDLRTAAWSFGTGRYRKFVPSMEFKARNRGNLSLQINSINDDGRNIKSLTPIRFRGATTYGSTSGVVFGGGPGWTNRGLIDEKRWFPAGGLRCSNKQLQITNAKVVITNSDTLGLATVDQDAKTVTLLTGSWPSDLEDHVISFENDSYVKEFTIESKSGGVLTVTDAAGDLPTDGDYKWVVKGYPKDEKFELVGLSINISVVDQKQTDAAGESGDNA